MCARIATKLVNHHITLVVTLAFVDVTLVVPVAISIGYSDRTEIFT